MSNSIILLLFPITCALVCYSIRKIIYISEKKHLFDEPAGSRKIHLVRTPNLGGVGIFATMLSVSLLLLPAVHVEGLRYLCACAVLLFFLGLTDDIVGVNPAKKMGMQLIVALLITIPADIRITSFQGFLGLNEMSYPVSIILSVLFILLVINAFNLIDGIDCLAGSIGLLSCVVFACYFWRLREEGYFFLSVAMSGCLTGFLIFNRTPARIFMGDTGSLFLGFIAAVLAIRLIGSGAAIPGTAGVRPAGGPGLAIVAALLVIPLYDTLRVFFLRILRGRSPFRADKQHIHHLLLELGLSHLQATFVLLGVNILALALMFALIPLWTGIPAVKFSGADASFKRRITNHDQPAAGSGSQNQATLYLCGRTAYERGAIFQPEGGHGRDGIRSDRQAERAGRTKRAERTEWAVAGEFIGCKGYKQLILNTKVRRFPFYVQGSFGENSELHLFDIPTTLLASYFTIKEFFSPSFLAEENNFQRLMDKEIRNFEKTLSKLTPDFQEHKFYSFTVY